MFKYKSVQAEIHKSCKEKNRVHGDNINYQIDES